jgi:hypothetical protein
MKPVKVKLLKGVKFDDLEDALVIWTGQVNAKMKQQLMKLVRKKRK